MAINRFDLLSAISRAQHSNNDELYDELLCLYYNLLDQEKTGDTFLVEFTTQLTVSESAQSLLSLCNS